MADNPDTPGPPPQGAPLGHSPDKPGPIPADHDFDLPRPAPSAAAGPGRHPTFPIVVGVLFAAMLAAGVFMNMKSTEASGASPATASTPAPAAPAAEAAPKEKDSAVAALTGSVDALKAEVAALTKDVKELEG